MRYALASLALWLGLAAAPAQAAFPKYLDFQTCFTGFPCSGLNNTWILYGDGSFTDQYGSTGSWFFAPQFPGLWYYAEDWLLFYDNGIQIYVGELGNRELSGMMQNEWPETPYTIFYGPWCTKPIPATGACP